MESFTSEPAGMLPLPIHEVSARLEDCVVLIDCVPVTLLPTHTGLPGLLKSGAITSGPNVPRRPLFVLIVTPLPDDVSSALMVTVPRHSLTPSQARFRVSSAQVREPARRSSSTTALERSPMAPTYQGRGGLSGRAAALAGYRVRVHVACYGAASVAPVTASGTILASGAPPAASGAPGAASGAAW